MLIRSRLVARDFKNKNDERNFDVFAATPPLEMKRLLFGMTKGSVGGNDKDGQVKLMYVDVKKVHLNGEVDDDDFAPCCADGFHEQGDWCQGRCLGRRLHVPREGEVPQGDRGEDGRVV